MRVPIAQLVPSASGRQVCATSVEADRLRRTRERRELERRVDDRPRCQRRQELEAEAGRAEVARPAVDGRAGVRDCDHGCVDRHAVLDAALAAPRDDRERAQQPAQLEEAEQRDDPERDAGQVAHERHAGLVEEPDDQPGAEHDGHGHHPGQLPERVQAADVDALLGRDLERGAPGRTAQRRARV